jgi:recA bacterial DNA recombination protein
MTALAHLETLLRARKLDVTLTTSALWRQTRDERAETGVPAIDAALGGGWARGHLSEIIGPRSAGRTTLLCHALAAAVDRGEAVALIDPCDRFDPISASESGLDLQRLLWVRGAGDLRVSGTGDLRVSGTGDLRVSGTGDLRVSGTNDASCGLTSLKAMNLVLQAGNFGLVALDLSDVRATSMRAFPFTTWLRMSRVIEGSQTVALLVGEDHLARSAGGITVALNRPADHTHITWRGTSHRARLLSAIELHPRVITARAANPGTVEPRTVEPRTLEPRTFRTREP